MLIFREKWEVLEFKVIDFNAFFLSNELFTLIVEETNSYCKSEDSHFKEINLLKFSQFVKLCLQMDLY